MAAKKTTQAAPAGYAEAMTEIESILSHEKDEKNEASFTVIKYSRISTL